jgi:DNA polymerase
MDWGRLEAEVSGCIACDLHASRTQTVFGIGNRQAAWMIIGEAPGADEDRLGEPFVGRAGKLLDAMLQALELNREKVFIANILKCRPPKNRDPSPQEAHCCWPFLKRQITLINPRIILAVGRIAAQNLLQTEITVGKLRGRVHHLGGTEIPVIVSYHPAYLLRSPREKRKAWEDLQLAQRIARRAPQTTSG